jgi:hypothetical protein
MFGLKFEGLVLWRDGAQAVVSLKKDGRWIRLLATRCNGMFHAEVSAAELEALSIEAPLVRRRAEAAQARRRKAA